MRFRDSLWDDSEPDYAPGLDRTGNVVRWRCPRRYRQLGYPISTVNLSKEQDIPAACRYLTRELLTWWERTWGGIDAQPFPPHTWGWVIHHYRTDEDSPFHRVEPPTRRDYDATLARMSEAFGKARLDQTGYQDIMRWYRAASAKGEKIRRGAKLMERLRAMASYGILLDCAGAARIKAILSEVRVEHNRPRDIAPTVAEAESIIAAALEHCPFSAALGFALQWHLALRPNDVRGLWAAGEVEGGINARGRHWYAGLTWDMISPDLTRLTKAVHKTRRKAPEPVTYDLTLAPRLMEMLASCARSERVGPVLIDPATGVPFTPENYARHYRVAKAAAGVTRDIKCMDFRAGAITDARDRGASVELLRDYARHSNTSTTQRYMRGRDQAVAKVMQIRGSKP